MTGLVAAWYRGWVDAAVVRVVDVLLSFPDMLLAIAVIAVLGPGTASTVVAVAAYALPTCARVARAAALDASSHDFIIAARAAGASSAWILRRHVWPLCVSPVVAQGTVLLGKAVLVASGLSFLGLGVQPPDAEWGAMLSRGRDLMRTAPLAPLPRALRSRWWRSASRSSAMGCGMRWIQRPRVSGRSDAKRIHPLDQGPPLTSHAPRLPWHRLALVPLALVFVAAAQPRSSVAASIAAGYQHTLVVKADGTVWAFGDNGSGQLGDGTQATRRVPQVVSGLTNIVAVAAGPGHSLALTSGGTVYAWGNNTNGSVGDGTTTLRKAPVALSLTSVVAIAAGDYHSLALRSNGDVYVWGRNTLAKSAMGQPRTSPVPGC